MNLFFLVLLAWLAFIHSESTKLPQEENYLVCQTEVCRERAKLINESLNHSAKPCDDFYSYACGGWASRNKIKQGDVTLNMQDLLAEKVKRTFKSILDEICPNTTNQNISDKVGIIYNKCMAFPSDNDRADGIRRVLSSHGLDGWPVLEETEENDTKPENATDMLLKIGLIAVFDLFVQRDPQNSTRHILQIRFPEGTTSEEREKKEFIRQAAQFVQDNATETMLENLADRVTKYAIKLKNLKVRARRREDRHGEIIVATIAELESNFSKIPLLKLLNKEFRKADIKLTENDVVRIDNIIFYQNLSAFLETASTTDMFNYAGVRVLSALGGQVSEPVREAFLKFEGKKSQDRWEQCTDLLRSKMAEVMDYFYVERSRNDSLRAEHEDVVTRIRGAFREMFCESEWIDNNTKEVLLEQVNQLRVSVGYPDVIMNHSFLEQLYNDIPPIELNSTFVEILHNISESHYRRQLKRFREPYNSKELWTGSATAVKVLYSSLDNKVEVPWALLQSPIYEHGLPRSLTYGAIGVKIAREMALAFDIKGISKKVQDRYKDGLSNITLSKLDNKERCFINQYENISVRESQYGLSAKLNGRSTVGGNIADNIGLQSALSAYTRLLEEDCNSTDTRLEGLKELSGKQLFFTANAMESCELWQEYQRFIRIQFFSLIPFEYRVNLPIKNLEAFASAFNCTESSPMSASKTEKCELW